MSDFKFNCPHCEQSLEAPEEMLGQTIECPSCNGSILLPKPKVDLPVKSHTLMQEKPSITQKNKRALIWFSGVMVGIVVLAVVVWNTPVTEHPPTPAPSRPSAKPTSLETKKWYQGGTLHTSTMGEWSQASYANRLATSSDFVCKMYQMEGKSVPPVDRIKSLAKTLEREISAAYTQEGANLQVSEVVAVLLVYMQQSVK